MVRVKNWVGGEEEASVIAGAIMGAGFAYNAGDLYIGLGAKKTSTS